jgi:ankyrin repeat protein
MLSNKDRIIPIEFISRRDLYSLEEVADKKPLAESKNSSSNDDEPTYPDFLCPITHEVMKDPVILSDGHTYEKEAILKWLEGHDTSPLTNEILPSLEIIPNIVLKNVIEKSIGELKNNLLKAAQGGEINWIKYLSKHPAFNTALLNVDIISNAIFSGKVSLMEWLLSQGVKLKGYDNEYKFSKGSLLNIPCAFDNLEMLKFLVKKQYFFIRQYRWNDNFISPLTMAVYYGNINIVKWLLKTKNYMPMEFFLIDAMETAIIQDKLSIIKVLIEYQPHIINWINPHTRTTALHQIIILGNPFLIQIIWDFYSGKDVIACWGNLLNIHKENENGYPLFVLAVSQGSLSIVKFLMDNVGPDISLTTKKMALHVAKEEYLKSPEKNAYIKMHLMPYLESKICQDHASRESCYKVSNDEFFNAIARNELGVVKFFFEKKLINLELIKNPIAINTAAMFNAEKILIWLIEKGADINAEVVEESSRNSELTGYTPVLTAIKMSRYNVLFILLTSGADLNKKVKAGRDKGKSAIELAKCINSYFVQDLLSTFLKDKFLFQNINVIEDKASCSYRLFSSRSKIHEREKKKFLVEHPLDDANEKKETVVADKRCGCKIM